MMFLCVNITPLGLPVVPDVYMSVANSDGCAGASSRVWNAPLSSTSLNDNNLMPAACA